MLSSSSFPLNPSVTVHERYTTDDSARDTRQASLDSRCHQLPVSALQDPSRNGSLPSVDEVPNPYSPATNDSPPVPRRHSFTRRLLHLSDGNSDSQPPSTLRKRVTSGRWKSTGGQEIGDELLIHQHHNAEERKHGESSAPKPGLGPRPVGGHEKLGTFSGVFVPTCLNVLSILMFLRFGFILGQGGVLGIMGNHSVSLAWRCELLLI
jgi:solute carrier family 12 (potassium/chloride transporters), member 9